MKYVQGKRIACSYSWFWFMFCFVLLLFHICTFFSCLDFYTVMILYEIYLSTMIFFLSLRWAMEIPLKAPLVKIHELKLIII